MPREHRQEIKYTTPWFTTVMGPEHDGPIPYPVDNVLAGPVIPPLGALGLGAFGAFGALGPPAFPTVGESVFITPYGNVVPLETNAPVNLPVIQGNAFMPPLTLDGFNHSGYIPNGYVGFMPPGVVRISA